jgi:transcriptional regulator with PAS, ATPase and Fis domain
MPPPLSGLTLDDIITQNAAMQRCLTLARQAAHSELSILLQGETGTGKTLLAQAIHNSSPRQPKAFVSFNASAMSDTLLESQLFGHEKGAFTGANAMRRGKFETADGGTLFFDEIADMSSLAQAKILRAVEYGEFERVGAETMLVADVRIISATNRPLREMTRDNSFREDLYHRLNGLTLKIPALRDRPEDLPALIAGELRSCAAALGKEITEIHPDAFAMLTAYSWPGNLRELHRVIQSVVLFVDGNTVRPEHVLLEDEYRPEPSSSDAPQPLPPLGLVSGQDYTLLSAELVHIAHVYEVAERNKSRTALMLGITRATLDRKLKMIAERAGE